MTERAASAAAPLRPLLKWAGGKRQLLPRLRRHYPPVFRRYVEPFLGSGAVFVDLYNLGLLDGRLAALSDTNADLIGCYRMVRERVEETIAALDALAQGHREGGSRHYYEVRDDRFNAQRRALFAAAGPAGHYTPELAAMLIYLNRTGFNGLFRLNSRGEFNVPSGRYVSPTVSDAANLRRWAAALRTPGVTLDVRAFEDALAGTGAGDFVYLDPPYAPLSATAQFTAYTTAGFGPDDQAALQKAVVRIARAGAAVVVSNSTAPLIHDLYAASADARAAGLVATTVPARRAINSDAGARGVVQEYLITNVRTT